MKFRSNLEANTKTILDKLNITWNYEPHKLYLPNYKTNYIPDFHLPNHGIYIEPKGQKTEHDLNQVKKTAQHHADVLLIQNDNATYYEYNTRKNKIRSCDTIALIKCSNCGKHTFVPKLYSWHCRVCGLHNGDRDIVTYNIFKPGVEVFEPEKFAANIT